jgi:ribosomal protein RSM22 (predicted rRNA methylase)
VINQLLSLIEETFPVPLRFRRKLPEDVAELSRLLTSARGERDSGYLNRPNLLSAYLRYFLPWNVFRLCRLFSFNAIDLADGDAVTDLGSGPLTLPIALWIAFPRLRRLKLEFRCVDKSAAVLEAGHRLFRALSGLPGETSGTVSQTSCSWRIKTIHGSMEEPVRGKAAKLTTALNVFNEAAGMYRSGAAQNRPARLYIEKAAALLDMLCADNGSILVVEPGNPQGGAFISVLRSALLERGRLPAAPCPHAAPCPLSRGEPSFTSLRRSSARSVGGSRSKWCHFAFDTETAPPALHKLSAEAGIPKERATMSYLLTGTTSKPSDLLRIRIISDAFPVLQAQVGKRGECMGCYGCSEKGLVLLTGSRAQFDHAGSGTLLEVPEPAVKKHDPKSGALIIPFVFE